MSLEFVVAGFLVGGIVGLTGVGGGAVMTPLLLLFGIPPATAVGTDLLYAAVTKCGAVGVHQHSRTVQWRIVGRLALGSLPGAALAMLLLKGLVADAAGLERFIVAVLSAALVLSALVTLFRERLRSLGAGTPWAGRLQAWQGPLTVLAGLVIGVLVTLTSVGAGVLGTAALLLLYPRLASVQIVGTELTHAVPLALLAGLGHLQLGNVDLQLLGALLLGSLPGIVLGSRLGLRLAERVMRPLLGSVLLAVGVGLAFGG